MIYLLNSFPNALQPSDGSSIKIDGISTAQAVEILTTFNQCWNYNTIAPLQFRDDVTSGIGHQSVAALIGTLFDNGATIDGSPCIITCEVNRISVAPVAGDRVVCLLSVPSRRLAEGEQWSLEEIQSMSTKWIVVSY
jgi:hypothetical protein